MTRCLLRAVGPMLTTLLATALLMTFTTSGRAGASIPAAVPRDQMARHIVERAITVHGGRQAWLRKKDALFTTTWTHYAGGQPSFSSRYMVKFPIAAGPVPTVVEGDENGRPVLMGISGSRSWFLVGGERFEDVESLKANRAFVRKAYGLVTLPFRLEDPAVEISYDGEEVRAGAIVDRVRVVNGLEPAGLFLFDRDTGRLAGMGSEVSSPPTATVSDYTDFAQMDGILIPRRQVFDRVDARTGGRSRILSVRIDTVSFDNGFTPATFEPPPAR